jgi:hypothetical protein
LLIAAGSRSYRNVHIYPADIESAAVAAPLASGDTWQLAWRHATGELDHRFHLFAEVFVGHTENRHVRDLRSRYPS